MRSASSPAERSRGRAGRALVHSSLLLAIVIASGCGGEPEQPAGEAATEATPPAAPAPSPAADPTPPVEPQQAAEGAGGGGADTPAPADACERAQACCPAYVAALPPSGRGEAGAACNTLSLAMELEGRPRDEACQGALEGFRASLLATGLEVPEACR